MASRRLRSPLRLIVAAVACASLLAAAAPMAGGTPCVGAAGGLAMDSPSSEWEKAFLDLLCLLYKWLGGDCDDLTADPEAAVLAAADKYETSGAPVFSDPAEKGAFLDLLKALEDLASDPASTLGSKATGTLLKLIDNLRADIAGM